MTDESRKKRKEKITLFIYRCIICICIFCTAFAAKRYFTAAWRRAENAITTSIDTDKAAKYIKKLADELFPL